MMMCDDALGNPCHGDMDCVTFFTSGCLIGRKSYWIYRTDRWREMERCVLMMKSFSVALHKSGITDFWLDDTLQKSL